MAGEPKGRRVRKVCPLVECIGPGCSFVMNDPDELARAHVEAAKQHAKVTGHHVEIVFTRVVSYGGSDEA